jgi:hypothetical protein
MAGKYQNGVYSNRPWIAPPEAAMPPQEYIGPFQSNQERLLNQSLAAWSMTSSEIQEYVRPNLPQIELFPPRYGYKKEEIGIKDIVDMPGRPVQRVDYTKTPGVTEATSRNTLGNSI